MAAAKSDVQYNKISRFPQMSRDAALLVDELVQHAVIETVIRSAAGSKLVDVTLFDVYTGENLPHGKRSLAYSLTYQDNDETLVEVEVNSDFERVTDALVKQLNVEVR
jgi:phenylalanyl-tRNA synthetase beta chain